MGSQRFNGKGGGDVSQSIPRFIKKGHFPNWTMGGGGKGCNLGGEEKRGSNPLYSKERNNVWSGGNFTYRRECHTCKEKKKKVHLLRGRGGGRGNRMKV